MKNSRRSQEGYLMVDHRASPGFTPEMRLFPAPEGTLFETRTLHCPHCGCCVVVNMDRTRERGHCYQCDHYICDVCAFEYEQNGGKCRTYVEKALGLLRQTLVGKTSWSKDNVNGD